MTNTITANKLADMLDIGPGMLVALVGGGGKTTLGHQLVRSCGPCSVLTTTTRMGARQTGGLDVIDLSTDALPNRVNSPTMIHAGLRDGKARGVTPRWCDEQMAATLCDTMIVEADGARHRPFKAPADHEPVIPSSSDLVISVIGADALGRVIADNCFRPLRVAAVAGVSPWQRLSPAIATDVLCAERAGGRNVPHGARRHVVITKVPEPDVDSAQRELVDELADRLTGRLEATLVEWHEPVEMAGLDPHLQ